MQLVVLQTGRLFQIALALRLGNGVAQIFVLLEKLA